MTTVATPTQKSRLERADALRKIFLSADSRELWIAFSALSTGVEPTEIQLESDFNRYFVGPEEPLAPPYASLYLDKTECIMSESMEKVRELYALMGLINPRKNKLPDDHIGLELDAYYQLLYIEQVEKISYLKDLRRYFLEEHIQTWIFEFIETGLEAKEYSSEAIRTILTELKEFIEIEIIQEGGEI